MLTQGEITSIVALVNAMLGGTILVLPLLGKGTGYLLIPVIALYFGVLSGYTTYLMVIHLGECKSIKEAVQEHFHGKKIYQKVYSLVLGLANFGLLTSYFDLLIKQIQGFLSPSPLIGLFSFLLVIALTFVMRKFEIGDKLLAYGIVSIIGYIFFLLWAQITAPSGPKTINPIQAEYIDLAAALIMAYSVQSLVDQILVKNTTPDKYVRVITIMSIIGLSAYIFISYGCYAIVNRESRVDTPQTIEDYFEFGGWQVGLIQILYFIHLVSAIPEFCLIAQIRFLNICFDDNEHHHNQEQNEGENHASEIKPREIIVILAIYVIIYGLYISGMKIATVIQINGSVIGYLYVILFPIILHIKCVYFDKHDENGVHVAEFYNQKGELEQGQSQCKCQITYKNSFTKALELIFLIIGLGVGLFTVYYTMYTLFKQPQPIKQSSDL